LFRKTYREEKMTATRDDIEKWVQDGLDNGSSHVIIACDGFDHDNYPVYIKPGQDVKKEVQRIQQSSMQHVDEVYDLSRAIKPQLNEQRAFNLGTQRGPEISR